MAARRIVVPRGADAIAALGHYVQDWTTWSLPGGVVRQTLTIARGLQGHPGVVHGGIVGLVLDDSMGVACSVSCRAPEEQWSEPLVRKGVTAYMNITFLRPCPVDAPLVVDSRVSKSEGRKRFVVAELRGAHDAPECVIAQADSLYVIPKTGSATAPTA